MQDPKHPHNMPNMKTDQESLQEANQISNEVVCSENITASPDNTSADAQENMTVSLDNTDAQERTVSLDDVSTDSQERTVSLDGISIDAQEKTTSLKKTTKDLNGKVIPTEDETNNDDQFENTQRILLDEPENSALREFQTRLAVGRTSSNSAAQAKSDFHLSDAASSYAQQHSSTPTDLQKNNDSGVIPIFKEKKQKKAKKSLLITIIQRTVFAFFLLIFLICLTGGIFFFWAAQETPEWDPSKIDKHKYASIVYDKNGDKIAQLSASENRLPIKYEDLPPQLIDTLIAVEDKQFYEHLGFNPVRIIKGAYNTLRNPDYPEGGSTLTVQLAKNAFIDYENRTSRGIEGVKRKIQEIILAMEIERNYTKEEILTNYFTRISFGQGAYGVRSAARIYFGKEDLADLTPPEIAMLCGLPQAPGSYNPYDYPERAKNRRTDVLVIMRNEGIITPEEYAQYKDEPFSFIEQVKKENSLNQLNLNQPGTEKKYPYFVDYVVECLLDENMYNLTPEQVYSGGLHIYTTIDPTVQTVAEEALAKNDFPKRPNETIPVQAALTLVENSTGDIIAMVGGRNYTDQMGFNRAANGKRPPGSVAKPLIAYGPALESGRFFPNSVFDDSTSGWPVNYDNTYRGPVTMLDAVRLSINTVAVKTFDATGASYCCDFARDKMGLNVNNNYRANALGAFEASPTQIAIAYSAFANAGMRNKPRCVIKIVDSDNRTLMEPPVQSLRAMKETTAAQMNTMLRAVVTSGTGTRAQIGNWYICGKTGTTSLPDHLGNIKGNPDAWFVGYSPYYTCAVWMGYDKTDKNHYLYNEYGGGKPCQVWKTVMTSALEGKEVRTHL